MPPRRARRRARVRHRESVAPSLDHRTGIAGQQQLAMSPDGCNAVRHEALVEFPERELGSHSLLVIRAQRENPTLAQEVSAVRRIIRGTLGFATSGRCGDVRVLLEAALRVLE